MKNFNTNQTRHFYTVLDDKTGSTLAAAGDIALSTIKQSASAHVEAISFGYMNGDLNVTRTDSIAVDKIKSINYAVAAAIPLKMYTISVNTSVLDISNKKINGTNGDAVGKTFIVRLNVGQLFDYDDNNGFTYIASVVGDATTLASSDAFYKALAVAIAKAIPQNDSKFPIIRVVVGTQEVKANTSVSGITASSISGIKLIQGPQKFVLGKLSGEPADFSISTTVKVDNVTEYDWSTDDSKKASVSDVSTPAGLKEIPGAYQLAELEYFALGERGDVYRGYLYPNDYDNSANYLIDYKTPKSYKVLSIEYFWAGGAEDVQKSPRILQLAAPVTGTGSSATCELDSVYAAVLTAIGKAPASGSGA